MPETATEINQEAVIIQLNKIVELLDSNGPQSSISIDNFDEIKAHLRNELQAVVKSVNSISDNKELLKAIKTLSDDIKRIEFNPTINVAGASVNVPDVIIPEIRIPDISVPDIHVPAPQVTVNTPEILIPTPIVNVPAIDLEGVINELRKSLENIRTNNKSHPLAVRLTDGGNWIKELIKAQEKTAQAVAAFPGAIRIQNASGTIVDFDAISFMANTVGSGHTVVSTAGTKIVLASAQSIKSLTIKALSTNTGIIYVGNTTVTSSNGFELKKNDSVSLDISDLNKVYIDASVNGDGVSYMWSK